MRFVGESCANVNQPPGSEKDELDGEAIHLAAWNEDGKIMESAA